MSQPRDGWDGDERDAMEGLESELAELRRKHQHNPSLALLRAADADALPPDLQAEVTRHLQHSKWSRTVVEGLRDAGADDRLDAASADRLFERIMRDTPRASSRSWKSVMWLGGLALAATVLIAVVLPRTRQDATPPAAAPPAAAAATAPSAPLLVAVTAPAVKLSPSALTWRGASENPFVRDLAPAFDAYRGGDYARAAGAFDQLAIVYPDAIDVRFYQGVSWLLAGDSARAVDALQSAERLGSATFADDVRWFLAVARQHGGNNDSAVFAELCRGQSPYASAACAAAEQLGATTATPKP